MVAERAAGRRLDLVRGLGGAACVLVLAGQALAGGVSAALGWGPDRYRSTALNVETDLGGRRYWQAGLDYFQAQGGGASTLREYAFNLSATFGDSLDLALSAGRTRDARLHIDGAGLDGRWYLQRLWQGRGETRLDFGYSRNRYRPARPLPRLVGHLRTPVQERFTLGFSQGLGDRIHIYALRDDYRYDRDPARLAALLIRRLRIPPSRALFLLGLPDRTDVLGVSLLPTERLTVDLTRTDTRDVLGQRIRSLTLAPVYRWGAWSLGVSASRSEAGGREDLFMEVTLGYFP